MAPSKNSTSLKSKAKKVPAKRQTRNEKPTHNIKIAQTQKQQAETSEVDTSPEEETPKRRKKSTKLSPEDSDIEEVSNPVSGDEVGERESGATKVEMQRCGFLSEFAKALWLNFLKSDNGLEDRHRPTIGDAIICKKDMAQDILLIFMDRVPVMLIIEGKGTALNGRWCNPCK
jgi:hypothetical protein